MARGVCSTCGGTFLNRYPMWAMMTQAVETSRVFPLITPTRQDSRMSSMLWERTWESRLWAVWRTAWGSGWRPRPRT